MNKKHSYYWDHHRNKVPWDVYNRHNYEVNKFFIIKKINLVILPLNIDVENLTLLIRVNRSNNREVIGMVKDKNCEVFNIPGRWVETVAYLNDHIRLLNGNEGLLRSGEKSNHEYEIDFDDEGNEIEVPESKETKNNHGSKIKNNDPINYLNTEKCLIRKEYLEGLKYCDLEAKVEQIGKLKIFPGVTKYLERSNLKKAMKYFIRHYEYALIC